MKFDEYPVAPEIKRNLEILGFRKPTDIQFRAIPPILRGEDVLGIAQTGTGKTAAFAIPVVSLIHEAKSSRKSTGPVCLVMVPTHELSIQVGEVFQKLTRFTRASSFAIFGGVEQEPQIEVLARGTDILVATPGRLFDLSSQGFLDLNNIRILILDEADHMLDLGFIKDIRDLVRRLPVNRQTLFFSATIDPEIKKLAYSLVRNPIRIQVSPKDPVARNIDHSVAYIEMDDKRFFLERIVRENPDKKILAFVRTKVRAERVYRAMQRVGIFCITLHGDKDQANRSKSLNLFKTGEIKLLIATDITARGIDIPDVDFVINYDLPEQSENYVHRVGRTGRGTRRGTAISFCSQEERPVLETIESYLEKPVNILNINPGDYQTTLDLSTGTKHDWKTLIREQELYENRKKRKKNKN